MSSIFDGMAPLLNDIFGSAVTWTPAGGVATTITARFREEPVRVLDEDGREILMTAPSLRLPKSEAASVALGDRIAPGNGRTYEVLNRHPSGSPAEDAFEIFELRDVT